MSLRDSKSVFSLSLFQPALSLPEGQLIGCVESAGGEDGEGGERVWVSVRDRPLLYLYHLPTSSLLSTLDCSQKLHEILRGKSSVNSE